MTGTPVRVAVQLGAAAVRVAGVAGDGEPWLVAELPAVPDEAVAGLLAELVGPVEEVVFVHPARRPPPSPVGGAPRVRAVPVPVAVASLGTVVLDVGYSGAECAWVAPDGGVRAWHAVNVGGRHLDELVSARFGVEPEAARRTREALSLLPSVEVPGRGAVTEAELRVVLAPALDAVVGPVRDLLRQAGPVPVVLVGGVARTPLLAELLDAAGIAGVTVPPRPDTAALLGALALPPGVGVVATSRRTDIAVPGEPRRLLGPPPRRRSRPVRAALSALVGVGAVAALLAAGRAVAVPPAPAAPVGVLVQYGYRLDLPEGWEHTGGLPERRRVLLTPASAPEGSDLIAVERTPLGYDSGAEPERARIELRAEFEAAVAAGSRLSGFDPGAEVAGRAGTAYRQEEDDGTVVEWFVVLDGDAQLSVGCRSTRANADPVRAACGRVVASVARA